MSVQFIKVSIGTIIQVSPLMGNLSTERVSLMITEKSDKFLTAEVTYYDVFLGHATGIQDEEGGIKWTFQ